MQSVMRAVAGAAALVAVTALAACGSSEGAGSGESKGGQSGVSASSDPIVIGSVGGYSGSGAITQLPGLQGLQAWVKTVNAEGGIKGRQIKLIVSDLGEFDTTKAVAAIHKNVEDDHVVAFAGNFGAQGAASDYIEQKQVPFIGGEDGAPQWWTNPMFFPFGGDGDAIGWGYVAAAKEFGDSRKLGTLVCAEVPGCAVLAKGAKANAEALGFTVPYQGKAQIGAANYSAQCLAAKDAGVDAMLLGFDTTTDRKIASDCARQDFKPRYLVASGDDSFVGHPEFEGSVTVAPTFPAVYDGPEVAPFRAAMEQYFPDDEITDYTAMGWVIGKALEKVLNNIQGEVTSQAILEQLWTFEDETLGGLAAPLTFVKGQPSPRIQCSFPELYGDNGKLTAPHGLEPVCKK